MSAQAPEVAVHGIYRIKQLGHLGGRRRLDERQEPV